MTAAADGTCLQRQAGRRPRPLHQGGTGWALSGPWAWCAPAAERRRCWPPAAQVPRSSRLVAEDQDYALFSCVVFKRVADDFKVSARQKGYQVGVWPRGRGGGGGRARCCGEAGHQARVCMLRACCRPGPGSRVLAQPRRLVGPRMSVRSCLMPQMSEAGEAAQLLVGTKSPAVACALPPRRSASTWPLATTCLRPLSA
jgi:hypothetical protein